MEKTNPYETEADELDFSNYEVKTYPVKVFDKCYTMYPATGEAAVKYRNAVADCVSFGADGKPSGMHGLASVEPLLISLVLRDDETNKPVHTTIIKAWPYEIQKKLYDKARAISHLHETSKERKQFAEALEESDNAPCTLEQLREWGKGLDDGQYKALKLWLLTEDTETKVKN